MGGSLFHIGKLTIQGFSLTEASRRGSESSYAKGQQIICQKKANDLEDGGDQGGKERVFLLLREIGSCSLG